MWAGFTLVELMIVVAIVAILAAIAYPLYQDQVRSGRRAEAKEALQRVMQVQERYSTRESTYTTDLDGDLGFDNDPVVSRPEGWYRVSAAACGSGIAECVELTAAPTGAQAGAPCGSLTLDSRGQRGATGPTSAAQCW